MSGEELKELVSLDPGDFEEREWAALNWTRAFLESGGEVPAEVEEAFRAAFPGRERHYVLAAHKAMYVANLTGNTVRGWLARLGGGGEPPPASCRL